MNSFQILDKEGNAISINSLDAEICELLGHKVDKKQYAKFVTREECESDFKYYSNSNWFDTIGWMIASENKSFQDIIDYYAYIMRDFIGQKDEDGNLVTVEYIYPKRCKLLNSWINKGYQPKQITD